jgi:hypothetical protein
VPRSRWKPRKASAPGIAAALATSRPAAVTAAAVHERRVCSPRAVPTSSSTGHTFSNAPKAASAPSTRGCRAPASSAATATAVTITS